MVFSRFKTAEACLKLLILVSAHVEWQVHVYTEDFSHFAAHCIDRMQDKPAADSGFAENCPVCRFHFFAGIFFEQSHVSVGVRILLCAEIPLSLCLGASPHNKQPVRAVF